MTAANRGAFRFQRAEVRMKEAVFPARPNNSIPSEIDLHRRRFPPPGSNPSNLIPLMPRDEFFPLDADCSVSARGRSGSSVRNLHPFTNLPCPITDALRSGYFSDSEPKRLVGL